MQFDDKGNKTNVPDKERQIEALQLLFLILPPPNRNLLKLLLDLLYQTAKKQDKNKMSAYNLALMFAPHVLWPKNVSKGKEQRLLCFPGLGLILWLYLRVIRLSAVQGLAFNFMRLGIYFIRSFKSYKTVGLIVINIIYCQPLISGNLFLFSLFLGYYLLGIGYED